MITTRQLSAAVIALTIAGWMVSSSFAQDSGFRTKKTAQPTIDFATRLKSLHATKVQKPRATEDDASARINQRLRKRIDEFDATRQALRDAFSDIHDRSMPLPPRPKDAPLAPPTSDGTPEILRRMKDNLRHRNTKEREQSRKLQSRIQMLRFLINNQVAPSPIVPKVNVEPDTTSTGDPSDPQKTVTSDLIVPQKNDAGAAPKVVVTSPVDSLRLANNLFGTGEYKLALKIYKRADLVETNPDDKVWIHYQVASCNRKLGDISASEALYREVVGMDGASLLGKTSRWWLDRMQARKKLEKQLQQLKSTREAIQKGLTDAGK